MALCIAVAGGFAIGRYTDVRPALFYDNRTAVFNEPIIEKAVRLQLGITADEPIMWEDLDQITEIHIYYDQTAQTWEEYNTLREQLDTGKMTPGSQTLHSLDDIAKMKNLRELSIGYAGIEDISIVGGLPKLKSLEFFGCRIEDITAVGELEQLEHFVLDNCEDVKDISSLENCTRLRELVLAGCRADDFSVLSELGDLDYLHLQNVDPQRFLPYIKGKTVKQLKLGYTSLSSVTDLGGIDGLVELQLYKMDMKSLDGIDQLEDLMYITLREMPTLGLEPLLALPHLQTLTLSEDMRDAGNAIGETQIQVIYQ
jgi:Leucine-rich repeat (LRR) protein